MRIIVSNVKQPSKPQWPKELICRTCKSVIEIDKQDVKRGDAFYSQREIDHGVQGWECPLCDEFNAI